MKLWYSRGACSLAVRIILNEMGIPVENEAVNLKTKQTDTGRDYWAINPKGSVPALQLENGEILTEGAVILQYLADHYQATHLLPPVDDFKRYRVLEWLNFIATDLHKSCSPLFNDKIPQTLKEQIFIPTLYNKLSYVAQQLQQQPYLCGKHFTLPDAYLFVILRWVVQGFKIDIQALPHLQNYIDDLKTRPSIVSALQQDNLQS